MRNRGFKKNVLAQWFSQVKYSNRTNFLDSNTDDTCYYQECAKLWQMRPNQYWGGYNERNFGNSYQRGSGSHFREGGYRGFLLVREVVKSCHN